jgi:hypothetical protein
MERAHDQKEAIEILGVRIEVKVFQCKYTCLAGSTILITSLLYLD